MICLLDNDLIKKLAICDLLNDALAALQTRDDEAYVLPTCRYVLLGLAKKTEQAKARLGEAAYERLREFLGRVQSLSDQPSVEEQRVFDDIMGIDAGEAILFSASAFFADFRLATGDKNSLRALHANAACQAICTRLNGNVVCFEQLLLYIIDLIGFEPVRAKVVPVSDCDTVLRAVFGSGLEAMEINVRRSLDAYIASLRKETGSLLVA